MKRILILSAIMLMGMSVYADEKAVQETDIDASGVVLVTNKQPANSNITQKVKIRRSGLIVITNCNGKVDVEIKAEQKQN